MGRRPTREPFVGDPPAVHAGDPVEIRDAFGRWHKSVARSEPRYDEPKALGGRCYLTVAVDHGDMVVNWPAYDVRPVGEGLTDGR